jgi:hypothetical protein
MMNTNEIKRLVENAWVKVRWTVIYYIWYDDITQHPIYWVCRAEAQQLGGHGARRFV